jgi:hypothetical protein
MRFKANFRAPSFDLGGYKTHLNGVMTDWLKQSGREWLSAAILVIPTWSKASRATFQKLANELNTTISYGPQLSDENRESLGLSAGAGSGLEIGKQRWHFKYRSTLRYLAYNEYNRVVYGQAPNVFSRSGLTNATPYHFQEKGLAAFEMFARSTELPDPRKFIKAVKV